MIGETLKESEARCCTIVDNSNVALFIHDLNGKIIDFNMIAHRMLGYERSELLGTDLATIHSLEEQKQAPGRLKRLLSEDSLLFETALMHKNGTLIPVEANLKIVSRHGDGLIESFIKVITKRRQTEQQLAQYTVELEEPYQNQGGEMNKAGQVHGRMFHEKLPEAKEISPAAQYHPAKISGISGTNYYDVVQERLELTSDFAELNHLHNKVSGILGNHKEADLFLACLHELISNAMEHGNRLDQGKTVSVELVITDRFIQGSVEDQGEGFNWQEQAEKPLELEGITERGRGIAMVRICSDRLLYNDKGNRATFIIKN